MRMVQIPIRRCVQVLFLGSVVFIGATFYRFVSYLEKGMIPDFARPAGVEAFLPISALVSLKHWLYTGTINTVHPSALVLFLIICLTALVVRKGFCSWICPIGFLSEYFAGLHSRIFKKNIKLPYLDVSLRSLKYLIAVFFIYQVFYKMPINSIEQFIQSPYNRFADIQMLNFFTQMSTTTLIVLTGLIVLSIFIQNFWCRYLCPYGAILGIIGFFSIGRINRNPSQCTDCGKCEKKCPGNIAIRQKTFIHSLECSACMTCVETCPEKDAIQYALFSGKKSISPFILAVFLLFIFTGGISLAKLTSNWHNKISKQEYLSHVTSANHKLDSFDRIDPEKMQKMIIMMKQLKDQQMRTQKLQENKGE